MSFFHRANDPVLKALHSARHPESGQFITMDQHGSLQRAKPLNQRNVFTSTGTPKPMPDPLLVTAPQGSKFLVT